MYPHVATGFTDSNAYLRELTLKSMLVLAPKLSQKTLNQSLLKYLAKLQARAHPQPCSDVPLGQRIAGCSLQALCQIWRAASCSSGIALGRSLALVCITEQLVLVIPHKANKEQKLSERCVPCLNFPLRQESGLRRWMRRQPSARTRPSCWATWRRTWARLRAAACCSTLSRARSRTASRPRAWPGSRCFARAAVYPRFWKLRAQGQLPARARGRAQGALSGLLLNLSSTFCTSGLACPLENRPRSWPGSP